MTIKKILIYAELSESGVHPVYYELLAKAKALFPCSEQVSFGGAVIGSDLSSALERLQKSGTDVVFGVDDPRLALFEPALYTGVMQAIISEFDPDVVLIGATSTGEELAPTLGARLKTGVAAHCTDLQLKEDGRLSQLVPAFGGKVIGEIFTPDTRPQIASVKPGMFRAEDLSPKEGCPVILPDPAFLDRVESRVKAVGILRTPRQGVSVEKAKNVVCGGYGVGTLENWQDLEKLAALLGGAVGCTRPALDAGWTDDESTMIGTSGKSIKPDLYLGVGISGAAQHTCGMKDAGTTIVINTDRNAEMFRSADYKVVGDSGEIIRALLHLLEGSSLPENSAGRKEDV